MPHEALKALLLKQGGAADMQAAAGSDSLASLTHSQKLALDTIDKGHKMLADLASAGEYLHHWPSALIVSHRPHCFCWCLVQGNL